MIHKPQKNKFKRIAELMYYAMKGWRTRRLNQDHLRTANIH